MGRVHRYNELDHQMRLAADRTSLRGSCWISFLLLFRTFGTVCGWLSLSKDGYEIKQNFIVAAGVTIEGQVTVNGVLISAPVSNLECNATRQGALRWNDKFFEGCDGVSDWRPITFCSRTCAVNTDSVPCGLPVTNACGNGCQQSGTGINMLQCILRVATTSCGSPVTDLCGNPCGLAGGYGCESQATAAGAVLIKSLAANNTAAYQLTTARPRADPSGRGLVLSFKDADGTDEDLLVISPDGGADGGLALTAPAASGGATPALDPALRVAMPAQLAGGIIELGRAAAGARPATHIFVDGAVDKECPFLFSGGTNDGAYTAVCLEPPTAARVVTAPDADGTAITSGNREDVTSLPGLRGDNVLVFTGSRRAPLPPRPAPPPPRVACSGFACNATLAGFDGAPVSGCPPNTVSAGPGRYAPAAAGSRPRRADSDAPPPSPPQRSPF